MKFPGICHSPTVCRSSSSTGFTLIELLVVIGIIGILAGIVVTSVAYARDLAKAGRAQEEMHQLRNLFTLLENDTQQLPGHYTSQVCLGNLEVDLDQCQAGLTCSDGAFPNWQGPYIPTMFQDPWGSTYQFDPDYLCSTGVKGCPGTGWYRAMLSHGPNQSGTNAYDSDNVVYVLCDCPTADCH